MRVTNIDLFSGDRSAVLRGAAAILEALDGEGIPEATDANVAKVIVENELVLRKLVAFAVNQARGDGAVELILTIGAAPSRRT